MTGDSLAMPLDLEIARRMADGEREGGPRSARGHRDLEERPRGLGRLSVDQVREREPDAVVVFIGANEGFELPGPGGRRAQVLRPCVGGGVRLPRPAHDEHLPAWRPRAGLLADRAGTARRGSSGDRSRGERRHRGGGPALPSPGAGARYDGDLHPGRRLPRRHGRRRAPPDRARGGWHPPEWARSGIAAEACWRRSGATSRRSPRGTACRCASRPWSPSCRSPGSRRTAVTC